MESAPDNARTEYTETAYQQFSPSKAMQVIRGGLGILSWPLVLPLALIARQSDIVFRSCSEILSLVPYFPGVIVRAEFYRFSLARCGSNVIVEFGAVLVYREIEVGSNVLIGRFSILHRCTIGSHVLIAERCTILSGSRQHRYASREKPMALQGGEVRRVSISDDCWIGSHAIIMDDVEVGAIVAAGAVVSSPVKQYSIVGGVPARLIGMRP